MKESVRLGNDGTVVINKKLSNHPIIAQALGIEYRCGHPVKIYIDRLIHDETMTTIDGWDVSGAISSILTIHEDVHDA